MDDSASDLALEVIDMADFPDRTAEVLGAVHYLHNADRRVKRGAIHEFVGDSITRQRVRYRLNELVDTDPLTINTYQDYNQTVNEYYYEVSELANDVKKCYEGYQIFDDDEIADPSPGTMIAFAGRLATTDDRIEPVENELGINRNGGDDRTRIITSRSS